MKNPNKRNVVQNTKSKSHQHFEQEGYVRNEIEKYENRRFQEQYPLNKGMIIGMATVLGAKKKVNLVLPKPNLQMTLLVAGPLNTIKANLEYTNGSRSKFFTFTDNVWAKLLGNTSFPLLPVSKIAWDVEKNLYDTKKAAKDTVGLLQHYSNLRYMSKQNAVYVANVCNNDMDIFISSGYKPNKTTRAAKQKMSKVVIKSCRDTKKSGEAMITLIAVPGSQYYQGCWCLADDPDKVMTACKGSRGIKMLFTDLPTKDDVLLFAWATGPLDEGDRSIGFPWQPR